MKIYEITQPIAELTHLTEEQLIPLTEDQLNEDIKRWLRYGDQLMSRAGIPMRFAATNHFQDRVKDGRDQGNGRDYTQSYTEITEEDMEQLVKKAIAKHGKKLEDMNFDDQVIIHDTESNLNVSFQKRYQRDGSTALLAINTLRNANMPTPYPKLKV